MTHQEWLQVAERIDAFRVFPRLFMATYTTLTVWVVSVLISWYMELPAAERAVEASGFAFGVIGAVTGLWTAAAKIYVTSGRRWKDEILHGSPE